MTTGIVEGIFVTPDHSTPLQSVDEARAEAGRGLVGDRHASDNAKPGHQLTLVEAEAVEAVNRDHGIELRPDQTRRNVLTRGVALNHLVGRDFSVGTVRVRGVELCEPCGHLESLTRRGVCGALVHRGGLRAEVLGDGVIRVGDTVGQ